jgi:endonuclease YncB( thermonuclease family)
MLRILLASFLVLAMPAQAETLTGRATVADGDTLTVDGVKIRLFGIDAPELDQTCQTADGARWACGRWARDQLRKAAAGQITCSGDERDRYGRLVATCDGQDGDIGRSLVRAGAAEAYRRYSTAYVDDEKVAAIGGLGLWQGRHGSPEAFRAADTPAPVQAAPGDCVIKGNISGNGRIYHLPGQENYDDTRISTGKGERWFCSEAEARAAGWRRAAR